MGVFWKSLQLKEYVHELLAVIPYSIFEGLGSIFIIGLVVFLAWKGVWKGIRYSATLLLVEYVILIYCSTVFCRSVIDVEKYDLTQLTPFWSYNRPELFVENVINVVMFVPVGLLLGFMINGSRLKVKRAWQIALMTGLVISVSIEAMQYFFHRGFAETDDVMHNTLGCILGYSLWLMVHGAWCMVKGSR